ncbi:unnamed protein product [Nesidiocoris tenuis]|uniref:BPL/LPL catalytic domain-containing protein n=1 Tax=Nesidiocoris tenuis TaxID=355587 RepID=A0A6H5FUX3_9HEMI|nr:unnamed protein product [Nesidiocoris tenuis]
MKCTKFTSVLVRQCSGGTLLSGVTKNAATMASSADLRPTAPAGGQNGLSKSVFISQSRDIFTNLALEDWMYKNFDFTDHHIMLLWRNDPCVVIGRHQNPWVETDTELLDRKNVKMARRNSGGGTVYHDPGNLNITFFSPKSRYNRKQNLEILANTLEKQWNLRPEINKKEDLIIDEKYKISGTASKLGRPNAYHHCTLLVNVEKADLKSSLLKNEKLMIKTNATSSVPAPTINLSEIHSGITMDALIAAVGWQYMKTDDLTNEDKGWGQVQKQKGFQMINPSEEWFPGIEKIRDEFASWEWRYGKTPKFEVSRSYDIGWGLMDISMTVESGVIQEVYLVCPDGVSWGGMTGKIPVATSVINQRFSQESFILVERALKTHKFHMTYFLLILPRHKKFPKQDSSFVELTSSLRLSSSNRIITTPSSSKRLLLNASNPLAWRSGRSELPNARKHYCRLNIEQNRSRSRRSRWGHQRSASQCRVAPHSAHLAAQAMGTFLLIHAEAVDKIAHLRIKSDVHCECCSQGLGGDDEASSQSKYDRRSSTAASTYGKRSQNTKFSYFPKMPEPILDPLAKVKVWQEVNESSTDLAQKLHLNPTYGDFVHKPATWRSNASSSPRTDIFTPRVNTPIEFGIAGDYAVGSSASTVKSFVSGRTGDKTEFHSDVFSDSFEQALTLPFCEANDGCPNAKPNFQPGAFQFLSTNNKIAAENRRAGQRQSDASLSTVYYSNSSDLEHSHSSPEHRLSKTSGRLEFSAYEDRHLDKSKPGIVGAIMNHYRN